MNLLVRADSSMEIGTGHLTRCITFADAWAKRWPTSSIVFVTREHEGNLSKLIEAKGYMVSYLPTNQRLHDMKSARSLNAYDSWLGSSEIDDANQTIQALPLGKPNCVLVDHYAIGQEWEHLVRSQVAQLIVFDDLANRKHSCDTLVDPCPGRKAFEYDRLVPSECTCLIGSEFAVLRSEFSELRLESLNRRENPRCQSILVSMGGVDKHNYTSIVLSALESSRLASDTIVNVVLGPSAPNTEYVREQCGRSRMRVNLLVNVTQMARLMLASDLAIGAAGGTSLERCCMGLPSIQVVVADNQRDSAAALQSFGAALTAEGEDLALEIRRLLDGLILKPQLMRSLSENAARLVDGAGSTRVLNWLDGALR